MPYAIHHGKALVREIHLKPFKKWVAFAWRVLKISAAVAGGFGFAMWIMGASTAFGY